MTERLYRVLVTGVGALIGQGIATSLSVGGRSWVLGLDRRITLFAQEICNVTVEKPTLDETSEDYRMFWAQLIKAHQIDLIIPGISIDMAFLDANRDFFEDLGVRLALNNSGLIALTTDKAEFAKAYETLDLPQIPTVFGGSWAAALSRLGPAPLLLKPSVGEGSVGIVLLHNEEDFTYWTERSRGAFLVQRIIGTRNEEYTVGTFGFGDGTCLGPLIFRRILTRAGNTGEAEVVEHAAIASATKAIVRHYRPIGPTNLQFRVEGDDAYLLEINPRFSSSCSMRTGFGFNEAEMCLDFYLEHKRPSQPKLRRGVAQRHTVDRISYARPNF